MLLNLRSCTFLLSLSVVLGKVPFSSPPGVLVKTQKLHCTKAGCYREGVFGLSAQPPSPVSAPQAHPPLSPSRTHNEGVMATCRKVCSSLRGCKVYCTPAPPNEPRSMPPHMSTPLGKKPVHYATKLHPSSSGGQSNNRQLEVLCVLDYDPVLGIYSDVCPDVMDLVLG